MIQQASAQTTAVKKRTVVLGEIPAGFEAQVFEGVIKSSSKEVKDLKS
jgi:hypothetical protein